MVALNYYGEYCAHCDGYGWDGCFTYKPMIINGWDEYASGCISDYHSHRMLNFFILHYIIKSLSLPFSPHVVILTSNIMNTVLLAVAVFFFFRISIKEGWKKKTEIIMFSFLFFNFHVLKFMGYCPIMTDMPAFTLCVALVYYSISKNKAAIVVTGLISVVVFPILSLMAFLMICLPDKPLKDFDNKEYTGEGNKLNRILNAVMRCIMTIWLPVAFVAYIFFRLYIRGVGDYKSIFIVRYPESILISATAMLAYVIFYWFATKPLQVDFSAMLKPFKERRRLLTSLIAIAVFAIIYTLPTAYCYKGKFSLVNEFAQGLLDERLKVSAAVTDLGFICWSKATTANASIDGRFSYTGIDFDNSSKAQTESNFDTTMTAPSGAYTTRLNCGLNFGVEYNILDNHIAFGVLSHTQFCQTMSYTELTASVNFRAGNCFTATVSHTFLNHNRLGIFGFALNVHPAGFNLFLGADYIDCSFAKYKSAAVPKFAKSMNFYFGMGFNLGKAKYMKSMQPKRRAAAQEGNL